MHIGMSPQLIITNHSQSVNIAVETAHAAGQTATDALPIIQGRLHSLQTGCLECQSTFNVFVDLIFGVDQIAIGLVTDGVVQQQLHQWCAFGSLVGCPGQFFQGAHATTYLKLSCFLWCDLGDCPYFLVAELEAAVVLVVVQFCLRPWPNFLQWLCLLWRQFQYGQQCSSQ